MLTLASVVVLAGCHKKPKTQQPAAAQPPAITEPAPPPTPQPETPPQPPILPPPTTTTVKPPPTKPKHKAKVAKKTPQQPKQPSKTIVDNGGTKESGQLSAAIPNDEAIHQRLSTAQLLDMTEANLKSLNRQLTGDEQTMAQQVRNFVQQSRAASSAGDTERAYNLAVKAHLLSDELVKPK